MYKEQAIKYYKGTEKFNKAYAAGVAMDNAMKLGDGLTTNCHFMMWNYLKYFSYEAIPK